MHTFGSLLSFRWWWFMRSHGENILEVLEVVVSYDWYVGPSE